ncbi:F-box/kelch-repeat protein At1g80440 [Typha angustifolia]|uniref:F-box/kelch-repeat protein At1g80440 n=1 Tax=Typha angustifolia TaxID=59011 RepID=UPI003C2EA0AB
MADLIPGLPDEVARECLIRVPYDQFPSVRSVCRLWMQEVESSSYHRLRKSSGLTRPVIALAQAEPALAQAGPAKKYSSSTTSYRLTLFDPATGTWDVLPAIPGLPHGLPLFCQLAAVGRELVVVGGWDPETWTASDRVYVYDFVSGAWRRGSPMPGPRRSFFACAASDADRAVYVAGGHDEDKNALRSALAYNVVVDRWFPLPDMAMERDEPRGAFLGGRFHVIGGYATDAQGQFGRSAEVFDASAWRWGPVEEGRLEEATCPRTCVVAGDGRMYVCRAGHVTVSEGAAWRVVAEMPEEARVASAVAAVGEGKVVVMGSGCDGGTHVVCVLEENKMNKEVTWTKKGAMPEEFSGHIQAACCVEI